MALTRLAGGLSLLGIAAGLAGCNQMQKAETPNPSSVDVALIARYGCGSCHAIPGVADADGRVGPPLGGFGRRVYIAGWLPNTADNLTRWLERPQSIEPGSAMPNMNVDDHDAHEMSAYLEQLR